jgi:23S rRNA pseudouridine1911/1915/1917 synthase
MTDQRIQFIVETPGERLDKLIVEHIGDAFSRAQIQTLIKGGKVTVDGIQIKPGIKLKGGEQVIVILPPPKAPESVRPEAIDLSILYEDADIAVIDKPAGMTVHPGLGNESGTVVNAILSRWPEIGLMNGEEKRAGIVHRLDKDTSGLMVIAKSDATRRKLMAQFQARTVEKLYLALLEKMPPTQTGRIDAPIARDPKQRKRMAVTRGGRPAITEYEVIEHDFIGEEALVRVKLLTGRTHQIRVHMAFMGCPIVGDTVYGFRKQRLKLKRHFLHATSLAFDHPRTGQRLHFTSPLPAGLQNVLDKLREKSR